MLFVPCLEGQIEELDMRKTAVAFCSFFREGT
jgi:hypothetical protein